MPELRLKYDTDDGPAVLAANGGELTAATIEKYLLETHMSNQKLGGKDVSDLQLEACPMLHVDLAMWSLLRHSDQETLVLRPSPISRSLASNSYTTSNQITSSWIKNHSWQLKEAQMKYR
jgi:hypothetical protein